MSGLIKRSFRLAGHRTSVALEAEFWEVLADLAATSGQTLAGLLEAEDAARVPGQALASRLRLSALRYASGGISLSR
jgi:predicted DNA-binding ribbon-helix-helix protein